MGLKKRKKKAISVLGIGWYREDQWPVLLQQAVDREGLSQTYTEWQEHAQKNIENLVDSGIQPVKIPLDVHDMVRWCQGQGVAFDGKGRSAYIAMQTRRHFG